MLHTRKFNCAYNSRMWRGSSSGIPVASFRRFEPLFSLWGCFTGGVWVICCLAMSSFARSHAVCSPGCFDCVPKVSTTHSEVVRGDSEGDTVWVGAIPRANVNGEVGAPVRFSNIKNSAQATALKPSKSY